MSRCVLRFRIAMMACAFVVSAGSCRHRPLEVDVLDVKSLETQRLEMGGRGRIVGRNLPDGRGVIIHFEGNSHLYDGTQRRVSFDIPAEFINPGRLEFDVDLALLTNLGTTGTFNGQVQVRMPENRSGHTLLGTISPVYLEFTHPYIRSAPEIRVAGTVTQSGLGWPAHFYFQLLAFGLLVVVTTATARFRKSNVVNTVTENPSLPWHIRYNINLGKSANANLGRFAFARKTSLFLTMVTCLGLICFHTLALWHICAVLFTITVITAPPMHRIRAVSEFALCALMLVVAVYVTGTFALDSITAFQTGFSSWLGIINPFSLIIFCAYMPPKHLNMSLVGAGIFAGGFYVTPAPHTGAMLGVTLFAVSVIILLLKGWLFYRFTAVLRTSLNIFAQQLPLIARRITTIVAIVCACFCAWAKVCFKATAFNHLNIVLIIMCVSIVAGYILRIWLTRDSPIVVIATHRIFI